MEVCLVGGRIAGRITYLDVVKYVAIFFVVWGHVVQQTYVGGGYPIHREAYPDVLFNWIYTFHMPLFMGLCGYFFSRSLKKRNGYPWPKLKQRLLGLFIPMCSFGFLKLVLSREPWSVWQYVVYVHDVWFLGALALNTIVITILYRRLTWSLRKDFVWLLIGAALPSVPKIMYGGEGLLVYIAFIVGIYLERNIHDFKKYTVRQYILPALVAYPVIFTFMFIMLPLQNFTMDPRKTGGIINLISLDICCLLLAALGCYLILVVVWYIGNEIKSTSIYDVIISRGKYTLEIYLLNIILLETIGGGYLYPWLCQPLGYNVMYHYGFLFELVGTFILACVAMEIIILAIKIIDRSAWLRKVLFMK